jgi:hypothetical protein
MERSVKHPKRFLMGGGDVDCWATSRQDLCAGGVEWSGVELCACLCAGVLLSVWRLGNPSRKQSHVRTFWLLRSSEIG